jgi:shikimate kinase
MNIVLTGYRCTGKTSVGRLLARMSGRSFLDTDELVCLQAGKTVADIVADGGWAAFRDRERSVIEGIVSQDCMVIATGGGSVLDPANVACLKKNGMLVWLCASAATIESRMGKDSSSSDNRPSLSGLDSGEEVRRMLHQREPLYRACADMVVNTDDLSEDAAAALIYRAVLRK